MSDGTAVTDERGSVSRRRSRPSRILALAPAPALALVLAACGGSGGGGSGEGGGIFASGSSTVEPITALVAERFEARNPGVSFKVDGPGTGDGFQLFCNGETDIADASRAIQPAEVDQCEAAGVGFIELEVAIDGLSVITSTDNDAVECLSFPDLYALVGPESQGFDNWSDADELGAAVGGDGSYPDAPLTITAPGEESGTYDSFVEIVLEDIADERDEEAVARIDYQASPNDNVIIDGVSGSDSALGWVGYSFAEANADRVKLLEIEEEEGAGCVAPTPETISDGSYPISRPLFIYVNTAKLDANPALASYVDFYLSAEGYEAVREAGYVELDAGALAETRQVWSARATGTRES